MIRPSPLVGIAQMSVVPEDSQDPPIVAGKAGRIVAIAQMSVVPEDSQEPPIVAGLPGMALLVP